MVTGVRQKEITMKKNERTEIDAIIDSLPAGGNQFSGSYKKEEEETNWVGLIGPR